MSRWPYNTQRWQRLRRKKLARDPLCQACEALGHGTPAHAVDHIKAIRNGGPAFPTIDRLLSLCQTHHTQKTAADMLDQGEAWTLRGCNPDGSPRDPDDPWNAP